MATAYQERNRMGGYVMKPLFILIAVILLFYGNATEQSWIILLGGIIAVITLIKVIRDDESRPRYW